MHIMQAGSLHVLGIFLNGREATYHVCFMMTQTWAGFALKAPVCMCEALANLAALAYRYSKGG